LKQVIAAFVMSLTLSLLFTSDARAQDQTQKILDKAVVLAKQIDDVLKALQTSDFNTQYAIVKVLLEEKEPALRRIGREFALFSTNPVLQNMAIVSVFNTNPQLRMHLTGGSGLESYGWAEHVGGVATEQSASLMASTQTFNGTCWADRYDNCSWYVRGLNVQYNYKSNQWKAQANLTLGPDGVLRGPILMNTGRALAAIDLKE